MLTLKPVTTSDYKFLYDILKERTPEVNISHKQMPTWMEHVRFWEKQPYLEAYIIYDGSPKGYIYYSKTNEVGIFLKKVYQGRGLGKTALKQLLDIHKGERVLANINPENKK